MPPEKSHWHVHETKHLLNLYTFRKNTENVQHDNRLFKLVSKDLRDIGFIKSPIECKKKLLDLKCSFRIMKKTSFMVKEMNNLFSVKKSKKPKEKPCSTCTGSLEPPSAMTQGSDDSTMQNDYFGSSNEGSSSNSENHIMQIDIESK